MRWKKCRECIVSVLVALILLASTLNVYGQNLNVMLDEERDFLDFVKQHANLKKQAIVGKRYGKIEKKEGINKVWLADVSVPTYISRFTINGNPALCIEPNVAISNGDYYVVTPQGVTEVMRSAYALAHDKSANEEMRYAVAQVMIWKKTSSIFVAANFLKDNVVEELSPTEEKHLENIIRGGNRTTSDILIVWESVCGGQKFVSAFEGIYCEPGNPECDVDCGGKKKKTKKCPPGNPNCPPEEEVTQCPPPTVNFVGDCGVKSTFDDPGDIDTWECIIDPVNAKKYDFLDNSSISSAPRAKDFCQVYCQEHAFTEFPNGSSSFIAGRYFIIGSNVRGNVTFNELYGPINFYGSRTCKLYHKEGNKLVEGIDTKKFINEYSSVITQIPIEYNKMKNVERQRTAFDSAQKIPITAANVDRYMYLEGQCFTKTYHTEYRDVVVDTGYTCWDTFGGTDTTWCPCNGGRVPYGTWCSGSKTEREEYQVLNDKSQWNYGKTLTVGHSYKYCTTGGCYDKSVAETCNNPSYESNRYHSLVNQRLGLEQGIEACAKGSNNYNFSPNISASYNPGSAFIDYGFNGALDKAISTDEILAPSGNQASAVGTGKGNIANCEGTACNLNYYSCSGDYCTYDNKNHAGFQNEGVANSQRFISIKSASIIYNMPESAGGRYISKVTAYTDGTSSVGNTIDLGINVLPLHFQMPPGRYHIPLNYTQIGHNGRFDKLINNGDLEVSGTPYKYNCSFNLTNDIMCNPNVPSDDPNCPPKDHGPGGSSTKITGGIDVIYRTIELKERKIAFPSVNGDGRTPGANWAATNTEIHHACSTPKPDGYTDVYQYITCNRGVAGNALYNEEPIYEINLTPTLIKKIREYNKNRLRAHGNPGYGDFTLTCNENGRACVAKFIHETFKDEITGTCTRRNEGNVAIQKDEKLFNACRYRN